DRTGGGDRGMTYRFAFGRPPGVAAGGMVATSQPLATRAGLRMLERGGNAADAALAAAAVLCVTEPMATGVGGDCFAQVWVDGRPSAFYAGEVAEAICSVSWLEERDLASFEPRRVEPLRLEYKGIEVCELPPPTQGVCALEALGLLERSSPGLAAKIRCVQLALEDALARVRDGADVGELISSAYLDARRERARAVTEPRGGTVYLCAVDGDRMAVSFIQSLYDSFGSGLVAPGTGVVLQNRGACFSVGGAVEPGRRPYHTIIPGMLLRDGELLGPFGVMGGFIQAQAHLQLVSAIVDDGLDPQAALDR